MRDKLIRVPNTECWVDPISVVCVGRLDDVYQYLKTATNEENKRLIKAGLKDQLKDRVEGTDYIKMVCFEIRLIDGKVLTVKHHDRTSMAKFLHEIGVDWDSASA